MDWLIHWDLEVMFRNKLYGLNVAALSEGQVSSGALESHTSSPHSLYILLEYIVV